MLVLEYVVSEKDGYVSIKVIDDIDVLFIFVIVFLVSEYIVVVYMLMVIDVFGN